MKKITVLLCLSLALQSGLSAQSLNVATDTVSVQSFNFKQLIIPAILIGYGVIGLESDELKSWNLQLRQEVSEHIDEKVTLDDLTQWAPAGTVFALDAFGIRGKNSFRDQSTILLTSYVIMTASVLSLKSITRVERPDGTSKNSFPSGHTATAFAGAEFLWQEYRHKSIWYGIAGYAVATGTGIFRVYNNRHWITDVVAGAGIGILSKKIAYWVNPYIKRKLFGKTERKATSFLAPSYDGRTIGLSFIKTF